MTASIMTRKGQVTIPKPIRDRLEVREGDKVFFVVRGDEVVRKVLHGTILDLTKAGQVEAMFRKTVEGESVKIVTYDRKHFNRIPLAGSHRALKVELGHQHAYHTLNGNPSMSLKWLSRETKVKSYCLAIAAIQMSFSGRGRPLTFNPYLMVP